VVPAAHGQPPDSECFRCIDAPQLTSRHTSKVDWLCAAAGGVAFVVVADPAVCMAQRIMQRVILIVWAVLLWSFAATLALVGSTAPSYHRYQPRSFLCCAIQAVQPALWVFVGCERTRTWHSPCTLRRQQAAFPGMFFVRVCAIDDPLILWAVPQGRGVDDRFLGSDWPTSEAQSMIAPYIVLPWSFETGQPAHIQV
jgi:hypothetical protein